jgi:hypothetical protein
MSRRISKNLRVAWKKLSGPEGHGEEDLSAITNCAL